LRAERPHKDHNQVNGKKKGPGQGAFLGKHGVLGFIRCLKFFIARVEAGRLAGDLVYPLLVVSVV